MDGANTSILRGVKRKRNTEVRKRGSVFQSDFVEEVLKERFGCSVRREIRTLVLCFRSTY